MVRRTRLSALLGAVVLSVAVAGVALATTVTLPWYTTVAYHNPYGGPDWQQVTQMKSNTGTFCMWWHSTDSTYNTPKNYTGAAEKYSYISLWSADSNGYAEKVGITVAFPNTGSQYEYCWKGFIPGQQYWFYYEKSSYTDGVWIYARFNVQDH